MMKRLSVLATAIAFLSGCDQIQSRAVEYLLRETEVPREEITAQESCRPDGIPAGQLSFGGEPFEGPPAAAEVEISEYGRPTLRLSLTPDQIRIVSKVTLENEGEIVELKLDEEVLMAPRVQEPIFGASLLVTGNFTVSELEEIAQRLKPPCE